MLAKAIKDSYFDAKGIWEQNPRDHQLRNTMDILSIDYILETESMIE